MKCYDTNIFLSCLDQVELPCLVSSITLKELEEIKSSSRKDDSVKYYARRAVQWLKEHKNQYEIIYPKNSDCELNKVGIDSSPDSLIILSVKQYMTEHQTPVLFATNDILCGFIAESFFGIEVEYMEETEDTYNGFVEVCLSDDELAYFYEHLKFNTYNCMINQYLLIRDKAKFVIDILKWDGTEYVPIKPHTIKTRHFGDVKAKDGDPYQQMAIDSFLSNKITCLKGSAGTGKTYLAMAYLFELMEKHKIDKILVFCNTVATMNSARLGFLPGTKDEKLMDSQIGNMLASKLGDRMMVQKLIDEGKMVLLPLSDIRGFDTTNMNAGIFISEAQNMDISLMKLALQRIDEDCVCIIDGDCKAQVDDMSFAGERNGMKRMSKIFRGKSVYGEVEFQNIYRSEIARIAEEM